MGGVAAAPVLIYSVLRGKESRPCRPEPVQLLGSDHINLARAASLPRPAFLKPSCRPLHSRAGRNSAAKSVRNVESNLCSQFHYGHLSQSRNRQTVADWQHYALDSGIFQHHPVDFSHGWRFFFYGRVHCVQRGLVSVNARVEFPSNVSTLYRVLSSTTIPFGATSPRSSTLRKYAG